VFRYIRGTLDVGIEYGSKSTSERLELLGYSDSDWGGDVESRKSTSGYVFQLANGPVSWSSKRQKTVALSFCEAEYMALTEATKEAVWMRGLLKELGLEGFDSVTIRMDNQGPIAWLRTQNSMLERSTSTYVTTTLEKSNRRVSYDSITSLQTTWRPTGLLSVVPTAFCCFSPFAVGVWACEIAKKSFHLLSVMAYHPLRNSPPVPMVSRYTAVICELISGLSNSLSCLIGVFCCFCGFFHT